MKRMINGEHCCPPPSFSMPKQLSLYVCGVKHGPCSLLIAAKGDHIVSLVVYRSFALWEPMLFF